MKLLSKWVYRKFDRILLERAVTNYESSHSSLTTYFIATLLLIAIVPVIFSFNFLTEWPPEAYSNPEVWNLTKSKLNWKMKIGPSQKCGGIECAARPDFDDSDFKDVVVPTRQFPLKEYQQGDLIFYRVNLKFPFHLITSQEQIILHALYIWADQYRIYINGKLVDSGSAGSLNLNISRNYLYAEQIQMAIIVDPSKQTYQGLENMGDIVIGPKSIIKKLDLTTYSAEYVWPLWGILPPLILCFIFCLFFLSNRKSLESATFSLFLASIVLYRFLLSSYANDLKEWIFDLSKGRLSTIEIAVSGSLLSTYFFAVFVLNYFRLQKHFAPYKITILGLLILVCSCALFSLNIFENSTIKAFATWARFTVIAASLVISTLTLFYLNDRKIKGHRQKAILIYTSMISLCLIIYSCVILNINWLNLVIIGDRIYVSVLMFSLSFLTMLENAHYLGQKDWLNHQFRSFMGESLAEEIINNPQVMASKEVDVVILFVDIRSFTSISERLPPDEIVRMLNAYMEEMIAVIIRHGGLIDKFAGDSIMVSWGVPISSKDDVLNAVRCSLSMREALSNFNSTRKINDWPELKIGIGLNYGKAVAGVIGSSSRKEYTLIGDTINTASRIESETKKWQCDILISEEIFNQVRDRVLVVDCGRSTIRGRKSKVQLFRLLAITEDGDTFNFHDKALESEYSAISKPSVLPTQMNKTS